MDCPSRCRSHKESTKYWKVSLPKVRIHSEASRECGNQSHPKLEDKCQPQWPYRGGFEKSHSLNDLYKTDGRLYLLLNHQSLAFQTPYHNSKTHIIASHKYIQEEKNLGWSFAFWYVKDYIKCQKFHYIKRPIN